MKLTTAEVDQAIGIKDIAEVDQVIRIKDDTELSNKSSYQRLIGRLLYLTWTRPDIGFAVQTLSQFLQNPKRTHMEAALKVVKIHKKGTSYGNSDE